ncbi:MAG: DUF2071 domain-containing protein [Isosphaeraceae bacterium]|nr:DUF2071 domain-containing protein [Isosphaeraceae bacterium]
MRQDWWYLLFLHWAAAPEAIQPLLPPGLDLDTFAGRAYVGLIPFTVTGARPRLLPPVPGVSSFHEVNLRTYVHRAGREPGVWFFSLDAASALAVRAARWAYKLPYHKARMRLVRAGDGTIDYASERLWPGPCPAGCRLRYRPTGEPKPAPVGTLEHFLIERYILYAAAAGRLYSARVHHAPYPVQSADVPTWEETLTTAAGIPRSAEAPLVHYAEGVRVRVYPLRRVAAESSYPPRKP